MINNDFKISVVMPAFNAENYIADAIQSVLDQSFPAWEVIVIDDGSNDRTRDIVRSFTSVQYHYQNNAGVAAALNHGRRISSGGYIAFISADDIWVNNKLLLQKTELLKSPSALCFGYIVNFISPEISYCEASKFIDRMCPMPAYSAGTLLTSNNTFDKIGDFDENLKIGEFLDWFGRARDSEIDVIMLYDIISNRRLHNNNHSTKALKTGSYAPALKALLERRRNATLKA